MAIGAKQNETRPMRTKHRGDICIHAAQKVPSMTQELSAMTAQSYLSRGEFQNYLSIGCIVAVVEIFDVLPSRCFTIKPGVSGTVFVSSEEYDFGNYAEGRFIYLTRNLRRLPQPVPARGLQCVGWTVPDDVMHKVRLQVTYNDPVF